MATKKVNATEAKETVKTAAKTAAKTTTKAATKAATKVAEKAETKTAAVKKTVKKAAAKKDMKVNSFVEFAGKQVDEKTIVADIKKEWTKAGHRIGEIKTLDIYIKPEEEKAYYVINGGDGGFVAL